MLKIIAEVVARAKLTPNLELVGLLPGGGQDQVVVQVDALSADQGSIDSL